MRRAIQVSVACYRYLTLIDLDRLTSAIRALFPQVWAIYLFGSHATGEARSESDVDVAVLLPPGESLSAFERWSLAESLARELGCDVDLVDLAAAPTVFQLQIVERGQRLFCAEPSQCDAFEGRVLSDYARLNEERAGILEDVIARGRVYE